MSYVAINEHRIPYDIDGTEVAYNHNHASSYSFSMQQLFDQHPMWLSSLQKSELNSETRGESLFSFSTSSIVFFVFFPELVELSSLSMLFNPVTVTDGGGLQTMVLYGSDDSTNGFDGTWESGVFTKPEYSESIDLWRRVVTSVSFSKPIRCLKIGCFSGSSPRINISSLHLFGRKAAGQTPDDIVFTDASGTPLTKLIDFGDVPEGTTSYRQLRVKNTSTTKNANNINLQLNHDDFDFSFNADGPWLSVIDIASLGPGSLSQVIYLRNHLNPPLLTLGPKAARIIAAVGSWT